MQARYERNLSALTEQESSSLSKKRVCVIGCGGLGGYIIENAARIGVGHIICVDGDRFTESNLNRQLLCTERNLGTYKAEAAELRVAEINHEVSVSAVCRPFEEENAHSILAGCDVAMDALDNVPARLLLQRVCADLRIPMVHGAIAGWNGQVSTILPGDNSLCALYGGASHRGVNGQAAGAEPGNLPFTAAATASAQCAEMIKLLIGRGDLLSKKLLLLDLLRGAHTTIRLS